MQQRRTSAPPLNSLVKSIGQLSPTRQVGILLLLACLLGLIAAKPIYAADFRSGDTIVIDADTVIDDDLFITGETVTVNGTIKGDLIASGATVTVNGTVEGSLVMAGRTLALYGPVAGSVYAGGYALTLGSGADIARNLYFGGYSLTTAAESTIGRSLYAGGYQLLLNGQVNQDATVGAGALELNGMVGGDLRGRIGSREDATPPTFMSDFEGAVASVPPGLRISPTAAVGGALALETMATTAAAAPVPPIYSWANARLRWAIGELLALLLIGWLLFYLRPTFFHRTRAVMQARWLPSLGVGLLTLVLVVVATPLFVGLLGLLTLLGGWLSLGHLVGDILTVGLASLGFGLALFIFVAAMVTKLVVAYLGGDWLMTKLAATPLRTPAREGMALLLGLVIYITLRSLPFGVGAIVGLVVTLLGLGAIYFTLPRRRQPEPLPTTTTELAITETPVVMP
ncbi:MAG: polymer-forming cytoskeletal protein [Caldilineaceae bacterium]|nr:polymer-forming cytoskeletal protein [Caldilineaceae bacterium]